MENRFFINAFGSICYTVNSIYHREDGPAWESSVGDKHWFINGKHHRVDGPAVEWISGGKQWFLNGIEYSKEEHSRLVKLKGFW